MLGRGDGQERERHVMLRLGFMTPSHVLIGPPDLKRRRGQIGMLNVRQLKTFPSNCTDVF